jgi:hypothetical protein
VSGAAGSNECPAGSVRIETEAACRAAAAAAGKTFMLVGTYAAYPRGCYYLTSSNNAVFNTHAVGAGYSNYLLLCAALDTTGVTPPHRASVRARVCCAALAGGVRNTWPKYRYTHTDKKVYIHTYIHV